MIITVASEAEKKALVPEEYQDKVVITGMGMINTLNVLSTCMEAYELIRNGDEPIINIGYVGSNCLQVGTVCSPRRVKMYQLTSHELVPTSDRPLNHFEGVPNLTCYTAHDFVSEDKLEDECIFDMELAAYTIIPNVYSIKVVSDNLNIDNYYEALKDNYHDEVRELLHRIERGD